MKWDPSWYPKYCHCSSVEMVARQYTYSNLWISAYCMNPVIYFLFIRPQAERKLSYLAAVSRTRASHLLNATAGMWLSPDLPFRLQLDSYFHRFRILDDNPLTCDCSIASLLRKDGDRRIVSPESSNNWECYRDPSILLTVSQYLSEDCSASKWYNIIFVVGGATVVNHKLMHESRGG